MGSEKKDKKKKKKVSTSNGKSVAEMQVEGDFVIQPEKKTPTLDTSEWPILLKNFDIYMLIHSFCFS